MSGIHKNPTISFRISPSERQAIEANIKASGMGKKDYFVRSCIYNHICVVGRKETIYPLVEELKAMRTTLIEIKEEMSKGEYSGDLEDLDVIQSRYEAMLTAIIKVLDAARYLWQPGVKSEKRDVLADYKNTSE
ncbi:MAG: hypothetical protein J5929_03025 [Eubacterium sp.]|nr:hypothetical protein [Eubacterium sp.]